MLASRSEVQTEPTAPPARRLEPGYVQLLADQGRALAAAGDLAAARLILERAAGAGDAGAALALGGTYDPAVLRQSGALGITGNPDKARSWYQKARDFGSLEAAGRLSTLSAARCNLIGTRCN
jgi:TPR repeat protein